MYQQISCLLKEDSCKQMFIQTGFIWWALSFQVNNEKVAAGGETAQDINIVNG